MPTSVLAMWPAIVHLVWEEAQNKPIGEMRVCDVGPGWGKGGMLLREYVGEPGELVAVEAWEGYVTPRLKAIYDEVIVADATELGCEFWDRFDVVLMIDVIEHMQKQAAVELLERISGVVVVCTPVEFFDNPADLPHTEKHVSHWTLDDFAHRMMVDSSQLGGILVKLGPKAGGRHHEADQATVQQ